MMNKRIRMFLCFSLATVILLSSAVVTMADEPAAGKESPKESTGTEAILPNTSQSYVKFRFNLYLPVSRGDGYYMLSREYTDPKTYYGYPPMMKFVMATTEPCDFYAKIWAIDQFGIIYKMEDRCNGTTNFQLLRTANTMNTMFFPIGDGEHINEVEVRDEEGYGTSSGVISVESTGDYLRYYRNQ